MVGVMLRKRLAPQESDVGSLIRYSFDQFVHEAQEPRRVVGWTDSIYDLLRGKVGRCHFLSSVVGLRLSLLFLGG